MKRVWMSVKQLAEEYGVSVDSVYRAYRAGDIPAIKWRGSSGLTLTRFDRRRRSGPKPCRTVSARRARPAARAGGAPAAKAPVR